MNQLQAPTAAYNVHIGLWLYGPLDLEILRECLQEIVNRHETLRTTFVLKRGELLQLVKPSFTVPLPVTDFSHLEKPYPPAYRFARQEVDEPFDLAKGPLFRSRILRIASEEHVLLCTMHHTITDAWSMQIFAQELAILYEARISGKPADLPQLVIQYGDYAEWQRHWLDTDVAQKQLEYWKRALVHAPAVLDLPHDSPRPEEQTLEGATQTLAVPSEVMPAVESLARRHRATPFMVLLAAFKVLLYRYSGEPDVLVGVPLAARNRVETEALIGFFVDTLVLRDDLSGNPRFLDLLSQVRETTLGSLANADVPFEQIVDALRPARNLSYNPIFQVMFSVIKSAIRSHRFGNIEAFPYVVYASTSILDLSATFIEDSDRKWWLQFDFNTTLFRTERIVRIFEDYMELLRGITSHPELGIDDLFLPRVTQPVVCTVRSPKENGRANSKPDGQAASQVRPAERPGRAPAEADPELLVEVWKQVLGVKEIGLHDNFFDVGGHSLLAARLTDRLQEITGRAIPVSAIFRAPTIARLAGLLRTDAFSAPDPIVMPLQQGNARIPFFAVAAPGVDSLGFAMLARHLSGQVSMYKVQGQGPAVWDRPFERSELRTLAQQYVSALRAIQPNGPFCLGGMCEGVQIVQEMILQLESEGEEVALFAILDTWVLENSQVKALWTLSYYLQRLRDFLHSPRLPLATLQRVFKRLLGRGDGKTAWAQAYWPDPNFLPRRFRAPVVLFKRTRQPYFYVRDREMGWGQRSTGGVNVCELKCGHVDFLREPYVQVVAQRLSERLLEINEQPKKTTAVSSSESQIGSRIKHGRLEPIQPTL